MHYLIGAADVGPAKYLLALLDGIGANSKWVGSNLTYPLFIKNNCVIDNDWRNSEPTLIITGTSFGDTVDKELVAWGKEKGVVSISVIEHWSWYRRRFEVLGKLMLPDYIFVNDEIAYNEALADGLPVDKLIIAGNPILDNMLSKERCTRERSDILKDVGLPDKYNNIVFISEELGADFNGTEDDLGYDEFFVLKVIIDNLLKEDCLIIKLHPEEASDKYSDFINERVKVIREIDVYNLSAIADMIVGMGSILLIELSLLHDDVISFRPNANKGFIGEKLGATLDLTATMDFERCFSMRKNREVDTRFRERFKGSTTRIASLIANIGK